MWGIDALVDTFPDVAIIWSHRNPLACTASICSMTHTLMAGQMEMSKRVLGPIVMDFYATSLERGLAMRDRMDPARFIDVDHDDFVEDSLAAVNRIYRHFDLPAGEEVTQAMQAHVAANPKGRHGAHDYRLEDWGLTSAQVRARFLPYAERFGIEMDG
jgi:hypothetical protein